MKDSTHFTSLAPLAAPWARCHPLPSFQGISDQEVAASSAYPLLANPLLAAVTENPLLIKDFAAL